MPSEIAIVKYFDGCSVAIIATQLLLKSLHGKRKHFALHLLATSKIIIYKHCISKFIPGVTHRPPSSTCHPSKWARATNRETLI